MTVHRLIEFTAALPGDIIILNGRRDADVPFEGPGLTHQISVESVTQGEEIIVPNGPCGDTGLYPTIIRSTDGEEFASVATVLRGDPAEGDYRSMTTTRRYGRIWRWSDPATSTGSPETSPRERMRSTGYSTSPPRPSPAETAAPRRPDAPESPTPSPTPRRALVHDRHPGHPS
jgi:hypothetical protein